MKALSVIGTAAMLWVGGGIILHALAEMNIHGPEHLAKDIAHAAAAPFGGAAPIVDWIVFALCASVAGAIIGGLIVAVFHFRPGRHKDSTPEEIV